MSKLRKIKTFLLFGLIAIVSIAGFCITETVDKKLGGLTTVIMDEIDAGIVRPGDQDGGVSLGDGYQLIRNREDLQNITENGMTKKYRLVADIEVDGPWTPIGISDDGKTEDFSGEFDGNGHTITFKKSSTYKVNANLQTWNKDADKYYYMAETDAGKGLAFTGGAANDGAGIYGYGLFARVNGCKYQTARVRGVNVVWEAGCEVTLTSWTYPGIRYKGTFAFGGIAGVVFSGDTIYPVIEQCSVDINVNIKVEANSKFSKYNVFNKYCVGGVAGFVNTARVADCRVIISEGACVFGFGDNPDSPGVGTFSFLSLGGIAGVVQKANLKTSLVIADNCCFDVTLFGEITSFTPNPCETIHMLYGFRNDNADSCVSECEVVMRDGDKLLNATGSEGSNFQCKIQYINKNGDKSNLCDDTEYYETVTGGYFFKTKVSEKYDTWQSGSGVYDTWQSGSDYVWWKLNGVSVCSLYPVQRAFLPIEELTFYNKPRGVHGAHQPPYTSDMGGANPSGVIATIEVVAGWTGNTWKYIYNEARLTNYIEMGYKVVSAYVDGSTTARDLDDTTTYTSYGNYYDYRYKNFKEKSSSSSDSSDKLWLNPQRHVRVNWAPIDVGVRFTTNYGNDGGWYIIKSFSASGVFELSPDDLKSAVSEVNKALNDKGIYDKCVDYFVYGGGYSHYSSNSGADFRGGKGDGTWLQIKYYNTKKIKYRYSKDNSGSWSTSECIDFYSDSAEGNTISMQAVLKDASLTIFLESWGEEGVESEAIMFEAGTEKVTSSDLYEKYEESELAVPSGNYCFVGWSIRERDNKGYRLANDTGVETTKVDQTDIPYMHFSFVLAAESPSYIKEINVNKSGCEEWVLLYPIFEVAPLHVTWIDPVEGNNDEIKEDSYGGTHRGRDTLGQSEITTKVYEGKNFPSVTYNDKTYTQFLINYYYYVGIGDRSAGVYLDADDMMWYPVSGWKSKIYTTVNKVPACPDERYWIYILPIQTESGDFSAPTITIEYYTPVLKNIDTSWRLEPELRAIQTYMPSPTSTADFLDYEDGDGRRINAQWGEDLMAPLLSPTSDNFKSALYTASDKGWYVASLGPDYINHSRYSSLAQMSIKVEVNQTYKAYLLPDCWTDYEIDFIYQGGVIKSSIYNVMQVVGISGTTGLTGSAGKLRVPWKGEEAPYFNVCSKTEKNYLHTATTIRESEAYIPTGISIQSIQQEFAEVDVDDADNLILKVYLQNEDGDGGGTLDTVQIYFSVQDSSGTRHDTTQIVLGVEDYTNLPDMTQMQEILDENYDDAMYYTSLYWVTGSDLWNSNSVIWVGTEVSGTDLEGAYSPYGLIQIYLTIRYNEGVINMYGYKDKSNNLMQPFPLNKSYWRYEYDDSTDGDYSLWEMGAVGAPKFVTDFDKTKTEMYSPVEGTSLLGFKNDDGLFSIDEKFGTIKFDSNGKVTLNKVLCNDGEEFNVYGVWGYKLKLKNTDDNCLDAKAPYWSASLANRVSDNNGFYCQIFEDNSFCGTLFDGTVEANVVYYDFTKPIMITSGSWMRAEAQSISSIPNGYYSFAKTVRISGSLNGLNNGAYFVGDVTLTLVSIIRFNLNGGTYNGKTSEISNSLPYNAHADLIDYIEVEKNNVASSGWILSDSSPAYITDGFRVRYKDTTYTDIASLERAGYDGEITLSDNTGLALYKIKYSNGFVEDVLNLGGNNITLMATWEMHGDDIRQYTIIYCGGMENGTYLSLNAIDDVDGSTINGVIRFRYALTDIIQILDDIKMDTSGNTFKHWMVLSVDEEGASYWKAEGDVYASGEELSGMRGNVVLQAVYLNTIKFNLDGGTWSKESVSRWNIDENNSIIYHSSYLGFALPAVNDLGREGYIFLGWIVDGETETGYSKTEANSYGGTIKFNFKKSAYGDYYYPTKVLSGSSNNGKDTITLKAIWMEAEYNSEYTLTLNTGKYTIGTANYEATISKIYGYPIVGSLKKDGDNNTYTIKYKPSSDFKLPTEVLDNQQKLKVYGWKVTASQETGTKKITGLDDTITGWKNGIIETEVKARWGDVTLTLEPENTEYVILLDLNGDDASLKGYSLNTDNAKYEFEDEKHIIRYKKSTKTFALPLPVTVIRKGYTFLGWKVADYGDYSTGNWPEVDTILYTRRELTISEKYGCVTLIAVWKDNRANTDYAITLDISDRDAILPDSFEGYLANIVNTTFKATDTQGIYTIQYRYNSEFDLPKEIRIEDNDGNYVSVKIEYWLVYSSDDVTERDTIIDWGIGHDVKGWQIKPAEHVTSVSGRIGNVTLKPKLQLEEYTVSFDMVEGVEVSCGEFNTTNPEKLPYYDVNKKQIVYNIESKINFSQFTIFRNGYRLKGLKTESAEQNGDNNWPTDINLDSVYTAKKGNVKLLAEWNAIEYTITLNLDNGSLGEHNLNTDKTLPYLDGTVIHYNIESTVDLPTPVRTGFTFIGWKANYDEGIVTNWEKQGIYPDDKIIGKYGNIGLTAEWEMDSYTLSFEFSEDEEDNNEYTLVGGAFTLINNQINYSINSSGDFPTAKMNKESGYEFIGWKIKGVSDYSTGTYEGDGKILNYGTKDGYISSLNTSSYGNFTLIAVWGTTSYTITICYDEDASIEDTYHNTIENVNNVKIKEGDSENGYDYIIIDYTVESGEFNLPSDADITKGGYVLKSWKVETAGGKWAEDFKQGESIQAGLKVSGYYGTVKLMAEWDVAGECSIYLNLNGGSLEEYALNTDETLPYLDGTVIHYNANSGFSLPGVANVTRDGYTFKGWNVEAYTNGCKLGCGNWDSDKVEPKYWVSGKYGCIQLTAIWEAVKYTLILTDVKNIEYTIEDTITLPTNVTKDNYKFVGWNVKVAYGNWVQDNLYKVDDVNAGNPIAIAEGMYGEYNGVNENKTILEAQWEATAYTITFDLNDKDLYYNAEHNVSGCIMLNGIDVTALVNNQLTYTIEHTVDLSKVKVACAGYSFEGWTLTTGGNWTENNVKDCVGGTGLTGMYGNITLTAKWKEVLYSITYSILQEEEEVYNTSRIVQTGTYKVTDTLNLLKKYEGYDKIEVWNVAYKKFIRSESNPFDYSQGSFVDDEVGGNWGGTVETATTLKGKYGNVLLYNIVGLTTYTISLDTDGGNMTGYEETIGYTINSGNKTLPNVNQISKDGYKFCGWEIETDGILGTVDEAGNKVYEAEGKKIICKMNDEYVIEIVNGSYGNVSFIARWEVVPYEITLNTADGRLDNYTLGQVGTRPYYENGKIYYDYTSTFSLPNQAEVVKTGYIFDGWKIVSSAGNWGDVGSSLSQISKKYGNVTLEAQWGTIGYEIQVDTNKGSLDNYTLGQVGTPPYYKNGTIYYYHASAFNLPSEANVKRTGYTFDGWQVNEYTGVNENKTGTWDDSIKNQTKLAAGYLVQGATGCVKIVAVWVPNKYEVTLNLGYDDAEILEGYVLGSKDNLPYFDTASKTISYDIENSAFNLPNGEYVKRTGYEFAGWKVNASVGNWKEGTEFTIKDNTMTISAGRYGNVTLTAMWKVEQYEVTFDLKVGNTENSKPKLDGYKLDGCKAIISQDEVNLLTYTMTYTIENGIRLPKAEEIECAGYRFVGWILLNTDNDEPVGEDATKSNNWPVGEDEDAANFYKGLTAKVGLYGAVTLEAQWESINYTITYSVLKNGEEINLDNVAQNVLDAGSLSGFTVNYGMGSKISLPSEFEGYYDVREWAVFGYYIVSKTEAGQYELAEDITGGNWNNAVEIPDSNEILAGVYGNVVLVAQIEAIQYTITFDMNDSSVSNSTPFIQDYKTEDEGKTYIYEYNITTEFNQLPNAICYGYSFTGWTLENSADGKWTQEEIDKIVAGEMISGKQGNITLKAGWEIVTYTVIYSMLEEEMTVDISNVQSKILHEETFTYTINDEIELLKIVAGYNSIKEWTIFGYYTYDEEAGLQINEAGGNWDKESMIVPTNDKLKTMYGNVVLYRVGNQDSYELVLNLGDENAKIDGYDKPENVSIAGNKITYLANTGNFGLPQAISRMGYTFKGWQIKGEYEITEENGNIIYSSKNSGEVYLICALGDIRVQSISAGTLQISTINARATATYITGLLDGSYGNAELDAVWEANKYTVTLNTDKFGVQTSYANKFVSGELPSYDDLVITYTIENSVTLPAKNELIAPSGYKALGWVVSGNKAYSTDKQFNMDCTFAFAELDGKYYIEGLEIGSHCNLEVEIVWEYVIYTVDFELEAPVGMVRLDWAGTTYTIATTVKLPDVENVTADAYLLAGWKVKSSIGNWVEGTEFEAGQEIPSGQYGYMNSNAVEIPVTLVAVWQAKPFTITFETGEFEGVTLNKNLEDLTYTGDDMFKFPAVDGEGHIEEWQNQGAIRSGYNFDGWKVKQTTGTWIKDTEIWRVGQQPKEFSKQYGDVVLIPMWSNPNDYTLTIILNENVESQTKLNDIATSSYTIKFNVTTEIKLPSEQMVKATGYTISKWVVKTGSSPWVVGKEYKCGDKITSMYGDATITAVWEINYYTLTLNSNSGAFSQTFINELSTRYEGMTTEHAGAEVKIKFTITSKFSLPADDDLSKEGERLIGWATSDGGYITDSDTRFTFREMQGVYYISGVNAGNHSDIVLKAQWIENIYQINLNFNGGLENSFSLYSATDKQLSYRATESGGAITYTINSKFALPSSTHLTKTGYTLRGWMVAGDMNGKFEYDEIVDKYNTSTYSGSINSIKVVLTKQNDNCYYITDINTGSKGDFDLVAVWEENQYKLEYRSGDGLASEYKILKFSELHQLNVTPNRNGYVFIGWSGVEYQTDLYSTISANTTNSYLEQNNPLNLNNLEDDKYIVWGNKILVNDSYVKSLSTGGDCRIELPVFTIYAVWVQEYSVIVNANGGAVYNNGVKQGAELFTEKNTYFSGYTLIETERAEIFAPPKDAKGGYRLYRQGYTISGWVVKIGDKQYYVNELCSLTTPTITDWLVGSNVVKTGINLRYLQGNIEVTPQWRDMEFDVIFRTRGEEGYKQDYVKEIRTEGVRFNSNYVIYTKPESISAVGVSVIRNTDIKGYSIDYVKPYSNGEIQDKQIGPSGVWNYEDLEYVQNGNKWEVKIEGYYVPMLYRIKLNLNKPFNTSVSVKGNDFVTADIAVESLGSRYEKWQLTAQAKYLESNEYVEYQRKVFNAGAGYYIYLLHEQAIHSASNVNVGALKLPTFVIDCYEMQYYRLDGTSEKYGYVVTDNLRAEEPKNQPDDWKYYYCDENGLAGGTNKFEFTIVWYRNLINFEIKNIIEQQNSANGYVVLTETEQVTGNLFEHKSTHVIVYALDKDNEKYRYFHFEFDGEYTHPIRTLLEYSSSELSAKGITKSENNIISVYFGNKVILRAYDQSVERENSLDEFVGYRFVKYSHSMKATNSGTCVSIAELNNATSYTVEVGLQNYPNLQDKDTICVNVEFANIIYTLRVFIGDDMDNEAKAEFGRIAVKFNNYNHEDTEHRLQCFADMTGIYAIEARINVNLGYKLSKWVFTDNLGNREEVDGGDIYKMYITPSLLKNNIADYSPSAEQILGELKAECKNIEFGVMVHIIDASTEDKTELESYLADNTNGLTIQDGGTFYSTVTIGKQYSLNIIPSVKRDGKVYYEFDGNKYTYRDLYLACSTRHSENQLITLFDYPLSELPTIDLNVTYELLDATINYIQGNAVQTNNRYLHFYVQVARVVSITFEVETGADEPLKGNRQIIAENVVVIKGDDGANISVVGEYEGYLTQKVAIKFVANASYYDHAELTLPEEKETEITTNGTIDFEVKDYTNKIIVKLVPKTYQLTASIEYGSEVFSVDNWADVKNGSGVQLLQNVEIWTDTVKPVYYYGDKISIRYTLNPDVKNDYSVFIMANNQNLEDIDNEVTTMFDGKDLNIVLQIKPRSSKFNITTNYPQADIGEVYIEVNNSNIYYVQGAGQVLSNELELNAGDKVRVFIKTNFNYTFDERYVFSLRNGNNGSQDVNGYTNRYTGYYIFELFGKDNPFSSALIGDYILQFVEVTTNVRLIYTSQADGGSNAGRNYTYVITDKDGETASVITENANVALIKGEDFAGYKFNNYSYKEPSYNDGAILLEDTFIVDENIIEYLSSLKVEDNQRTWYIYVNFVKQYTITLKIHNSDLISASVEDIEGNQLDAGIQYNGQNGWSTAHSAGYYDAGQIIVFNISATDTKHYYILATFNNGGEYRPNEKEGYWTNERNNLRNNYGIVANGYLYQYKYTDNNALSGFILPRVLQGNIEVEIITCVENFDTILTEHYQTGEGELETGETKLLSSSGHEFNTKPTIHYQVSSDFYYNSKVRLVAYIEKPVEDANGYYQLASVQLGGQELELGECRTGLYNGKTCYIYTIEYVVEESLLEYNEEQLKTLVQLDITYKGVKKVQIEIDTKV